MSDYLPVPLSRRGALDPESAAARLLRAFLNGRKAETITAYRQDLEDFQAFIHAPSLEQAASLLLTRGPGVPFVLFAIFPRKLGHFHPEATL